VIPEEALRAAAVRSCEIYVRCLEQGYDPENQHVFPAEFDKRIRKLRRRADHPVFYRTMYRVASTILALLIAGGVWLTVDAKARAAFVGWVMEIGEAYVEYFFGTKAPAGSEETVYRPAWLPDGYTELYCDDSEDTVFVAYSNDAGQMMNFSYIHAPDETKWLVDTSGAVMTQVKVNDSAATLFTSTDPNNASAIMWSTADQTAFFVSAFLDDAALIRLAESVAPAEK